MLPPGGMERRQMLQDESGVLGSTPFEHVERLRRRQVFEQQYALPGLGPQGTVIQARGSEGNVSRHLSVKAELPFVQPGLKHGSSNVGIRGWELKFRDQR